MCALLDSRQAIDALSNFGFVLKEVSRLFSRNFEHHCAEIGLTLAQCRVLGYLQRHEGISQARLAELTDSDPMTLGRLLVRMEAGALVERRHDPTDGRAHCLYLGPKAAPLLDEIWRLSDRTRAEALRGLTAADRGQLLALLQRVCDNLNAPMPAAAVPDRGPSRTTTALATAPRRAQRKVA
ncbi:MAG: MarR family transcriptional regulator [Burkholderiales bacterium PBB5]|nr:MAG: MarR family transcriptional regulator [Burkholderiales bacterium PBB5]